MKRAYIALGSNLGDREGHLRRALAELEGLGAVGCVSSFYETEPVGTADQGWFLNAVAGLDTALPPGELLGGMRDIERRLGRERAVPQGPRTMDLDLLLYENEVVVTEELVVPHPRLAERRFVLEPLAEIAPRARHPGTGRTVREMLAAVGDAHQVKKLP